MRRLRSAYSGHDPMDLGMDWQAVRRAPRLVCKDGYAFLRGRLLRMMGTKATASCGAVIAHHQAPLSMVLRELREAEKSAKRYRRPGRDGRMIDRDAFHLTVIKRSGGTLHLSGEWGEPLDALVLLRDFLADPAVSRRAVYNSLVWLKDLPLDASADMLGSLLAYQLKRQTAGIKAWETHKGLELCNRLAALACREGNRLDWLCRFMGVSEFLAREARAGAIEAEPAVAKRTS
jgi:CRISPR-associated protein Cmr2